MGHLLGVASLVVVVVSLFADTNTLFGVCVCVCACVFAFLCVYVSLCVCVFHFQVGLENDGCGQIQKTMMTRIA